MVVKFRSHHEIVIYPARPGESGTIVTRRLKTPLRTVQKIIKRWKDEENPSVKPKSGLPHSVNERRIRELTEKKDLLQ